MFFNPYIHMLDALAQAPSPAQPDQSPQQKGYASQDAEPPYASYYPQQANQSYAAAPYAYYPQAGQYYAPAQSAAYAPYAPYASYYPQQANQPYVDYLTASASPQAYAAYQGYNNPAYSYVAPVNIGESDSAYEIQAEMPGVADESIEVYVRDGLLNIRGYAEQEAPEHNGQLHCAERHAGVFERAIPLNAQIDDSAIKTTACNGVVRVVVPKSKKKSSKASSSGARRITPANKAA